MNSPSPITPSYLALARLECPVHDLLEAVTAQAVRTRAHRVRRRVAGFAGRVHVQSRLLRTPMCLLRRAVVNLNQATEIKKLAGENATVTKGK